MWMPLLRICLSSPMRRSRTWEAQISHTTSKVKMTRLESKPILM